MGKHTKGPWGEIHEFGNGLTVGINYPDDRDHYMAEVTCGDPDELTANALLMRASPDLYTACKVALKLLDSVAFVSKEGDTAKPLRLLRTAIAKADGKSRESEPHPCTCHPDDNPPRLCPRKYAFSECREEARSVLAKVGA